MKSFNCQPVPRSTVDSVMESIYCRMRNRLIVDSLHFPRRNTDQIITFQLSTVILSSGRQYIVLWKVWIVKRQPVPMSTVYHVMESFSCQASTCPHVDNRSSYRKCQLSTLDHVMETVKCQPSTCLPGSTVYRSCCGKCQLSTIDLSPGKQ